jgi:hypothetical protein
MRIVGRGSAGVPTGSCTTPRHGQAVVPCTLPHDDGRFGLRNRTTTDGCSFFTLSGCPPAPWHRRAGLARAVSVRARCRPAVLEGVCNRSYLS